MNRLIKIVLIMTFQKQLICLETVSLPKFNVSINETSISGHSSGAYFTVQLQVAHSSIFKGVGVIAGGHYDCLRHVKSLFLCAVNKNPSVSESISQTNKWSGSLIDDTLYMRNHKVYLLAETLDGIVGEKPMTQLYKYYVTEGQYIPEQNVKLEIKKFPHLFPTDNDSNGKTCSNFRGTCIGNCGFDGAGAILNHIYDNLKPRVSKGNRTGSFIKFDQSEFLEEPKTYGLDNSGYAYIPRACSEQQKCRLHIAFHGCFMSYFFIRFSFIKNTDYDLWADSNNLIVVFPQTYPDLIPRLIVTNEKFINSPSCWDFLGLYDQLYDTKEGKQIKFIRNIIDRIASG